MSKNDLISLALIYHEPMHAYAINTVIQEMGLEHWAHISPASIYSTLSRLEKADCVVVSAEKAGNMPEKKVYRITASGRKRFMNELKDAFSYPGIGDNPFYLAVMFAYGITVEAALPCLQERITHLKKAHAHVSQEYDRLKEVNGYSGMIITKAGRKHVEIEIEMVKEVIKLLETKPDFYNNEMKNMVQELLKHKGASGFPPSCRRNLKG